MSRWLLGVAGFLAFIHASGLLLGRPIFRYAEVLALLALLAYALLRGLPAPRWALPAGLAALLVDALINLPEPFGPAPEVFLGPFVGPEFLPGPSAFEVGLHLIWAPFLFSMAVLMTAFPLEVRPLPFVLGAVVLGYTAFFALQDFLAPGSSSVVFDTPASRLPGVVMPVIMGLGAATLAFRRGLLATTGAVTLTLAALLHINATFIPYYPTFPWAAEALTSALELTAYLLVLAGLKSRAPASAPS